MTKIRADISLSGSERFFPLSILICACFTTNNEILRNREKDLVTTATLEVRLTCFEPASERASVREVLRPDPSQTSRTLASLAGWNFAVLTSRASARETAHKSRKRKYDIVTLVHFMRNARWSFLTAVLRSRQKKLSTIASHSLKGLSVSHRLQCRRHF